MATTETAAQNGSSDVHVINTKEPREEKKKTSRVHHHDDDKLVKAQSEALEYPIKDVILNDERNPRSGLLPDITGLVESIKKEGILEPLIGMQARDEEGNAIEGKIELVAGYRRYKAAKEAGLKTVPVRFISSDRNRQHRVALVENLQRADMNAMDKARGIQKLMEDEELDQKGAAEALGFSPGFISQHLSLLKLPKKAQERVAKGRLEWTSARELGRIGNDDIVIGLLDAAEEMTATDLKNKVEFIIAKEKEKAKAAEAKDGTAKPKKKGAKADEPEKKSLAEKYAELELEPLKKTDLRTALQQYAEKLDRSESETKRTEYKYVLKGLEIAAGLKE